MSSSSIQPNLIQQLQTKLSATPLHISSSKSAVSSSLPPDDLESGYRDPTLVASDVAAHLSFLRKQKFQYLELNAKDKYIKTIVTDDAPLTTQSINEALRISNERKKSILKEAKARLKEKEEDVRQLAPLVEQDYNRALRQTTEAQTLSDKILDAQLSLTRLRQQSSSSRLTIPTATALLDTQAQQLQDLDLTLQDLQKKLSVVKDKVKDGSREVERLRVERSEVERTMREKERDGMTEEDGRLVPLYDWYTASLSLHRTMHHLLSSHSETENELRLTYLVRPKSSSHQREITISLIFVPNTHTLDSASIVGLCDGEDMAELVEWCVQGNDVSGLVCAVLARLRG